MGKIILGLAGMIFGSFMVIKSEWFLSFFGRVNWAEIHLSSEGGTRVFFKLLGIIIIFFSLLIMTGMIEGVFLAIFSPLFSNAGK